MARIGSVRPRFASVVRQTAAPPAPKVVEEHYGTAAHKAWAAQVVKRAGGRCQGKGCGRTGVRLVADHIVERKDSGPDLDLANGQALCWSCHTTKTNEARFRRTASRT